MDVFAYKAAVLSRSDDLHVYWLHDIHKGAPNFDAERFQKIIKVIKNDKAVKIVLLGGDLVDAVVLRDLKRFSPDNLDDEVLTGTPKQIRKNIANLAANQAKKIAKMLEPIKESIIASVRGNHEMTVLKSSGIDLHAMICEELGIRDSGDVGMVCVNLWRNLQSKLFRIAYMHTASGGRTAGASANSIARGLNIFDAEIVLQGHNHSPAVQRVVSIGCTNPGVKQTPVVVRRDRVGVNNGSFLKCYQAGVDSYDQEKLYNPKDEVFHRISVKMIEDHTSKKTYSTPRLSIIVEELHI